MNPLSDRILTLPADEDFLLSPVEPVHETDFNSVAIDNAFSTMEATMEGIGIGLAGNQMGYPYRIFIMQYGKDVIRAINPDIIDVSDEEEFGQEGCLSIPANSYMVSRPTKLTLRYYRQDGMRMYMLCQGLAAKCVRHEIDHLNGLLIAQTGIPVIKGLS